MVGKYSFIEPKMNDHYKTYDFSWKPKIVRHVFILTGMQETSGIGKQEIKIL